MKDWRFDFVVLNDADGEPVIGLRVDAVMLRTGQQHVSTAAPSSAAPLGRLEAVPIGRAGRRRAR